VSRIKFKDVAKGTRAIKRVTCPLVNVPCALLPDVPELAEQRARDRKKNEQGGAATTPTTSVDVGLRVLTGTEVLDILDRAAQKAIARNQKPDESSPIYQLAVSVYTLAASCVVADSDPEKPIPFFGDSDVPGAGVENWESAYEEILASPHLGRDGILFLTDQQEAWQDICNPQALKIGHERLWQLAGEVAADDTGRPFFSLRPAMRWSFARFMAIQLLSLMTSQSQRTSGSDSDTPSDTSGSSEAP
jgi:hypothetical protein